MKQRRITAILCIILSLVLAACGTQVDESTQPSENTPSSAATESTQPQSDYQTAYRAARIAAENLFEYTLTFDCRITYTVGNQNYSDSSHGTAVFSGLDTDNMQILVSENLTFGSYETAYYRSYIDGVGYCRVNNCNFTCYMTPEDFLLQTLPAVLLNEVNYETVTAEAGEDGIHFNFSNAIAPEGWMENSENLILTAASGTALLNSSEELVASSYHAEYLFGGIPYVLDVTVGIDTQTPADFTGQPVYGENCPVLSDLRIPQLLIQTVGAVFSTRDMTATYTDTLYSEAFALIRSQAGSCNIFGSGKDLAALMSSHVSVTDYTGTAISNAQDVSFSNGVYSYSTNGGESVTVDTVTAGEMRIYCEDTILSSLFSLESIRGAALTTTDDFIYIEFDGNSEFSDRICTGIYDILGFNLDSYASSYDTTVSSGYLALNRYTRLPTAAGMSLERIHNISGVPSRLTYQLDQSMELPSTSAYETLTGNAPAEEAPKIAATPLFYKVTGPKGQQMWLLGTIHVGDERTNFLPEQIMAAFNSADALAVEFDHFAFNDALRSEPELQQEYSSAYYYAGGTTVSQHLDDTVAETMEMLMKISGSYSINAPYARVAVWNNLLEKFYLAQGSSLLTGKGMDSRLLGWAKEQNKTIYEIESGLSQLQILAGFSDELQQMLLQELLDAGMIGYCAGVEELYELWCAGDEAALMAYLAADTSNLTAGELGLWQEYNKAMYTNRNKAMAKMAMQYLESGETVFYAVGLAHLLGEGGVIQRLQDAGYTVELVNFE